MAGVVVWWFLVMAAASGPATTGFNIDTIYPLVWTSTQQGNYYGYTVALRDIGDGDYRLVIGAPRGNSSYTSHASLIEPGVVYQCKVREGKCDQLALDLSGNTKKILANGAKIQGKKDYGWIGASIAVQHDPRSPMLVCAPRWKNNFYKQFYFMNGICYLSQAASKPGENASILFSIAGREEGFTITSRPGQNKSVYYYAYGEAGVSAHFTKSGASLLIGAPGIFEWTGSIIVYPNIRMGQTDLKIPNPYHTPEQETHDYFGFAVSSGNFFTKPVEASGTLYVSGAPRASLLRGKVFVFALPAQQDRPLDIRAEKVGEQVGEYFGSSLCVLDLNADGLDDLVVGAPYHTLREPGKAGWDEGRVYVFISEDQGRLKEVTSENKLVGDGESGANFGMSIASLGDINADGYPDIAVGAPYGGRDGAGAIFIYHGHRDGINTKYSQRILGTDVHWSIRAFGISISNGMDVDGNGYNDVAVGAYVSGHAVVLRSRPVVALHAELTADVSRISINATNFQVAACISYTGKKVPSAIDVNCMLTVDSAMSVAYFLSGIDHESNKLAEVITVDIGSPSCKKYTVNLKPGFKDFSKPISVKLNCSLHEKIILLRRRRSAFDDFCKDCPVLDPSQPTSVTLHVPFATGCGEEDICRTDLKLTAEFVNTEQPLILGTQSVITVAVAVENRLDPAFFARVLIEAPLFLVLIRMPSLCREDSTASLLRLDCGVGNPLTSRYGMKNIMVELDVGNVPWNTTTLELNVTATSTGQEQMPSDNNNTLLLGIRTVSDIRMIGSSSQDTVYFSKVDNSSGDVTIIHSYEVRNYGPSKVDSMQLTFRIPVTLLVGEKTVTFNKLYQPKTSLAGEPFFCSANNYEYFTDSSSWGNVAAVEVDSNLPGSTRKRRSAGNSGPLTVGDVANGTLYLNCSQEQTTCITITCSNVGPLRSVQTSAIIQLRMTTSIRGLVPLLGKREFVVLSTSGSIVDRIPPNSEQTSSESIVEKTVGTMFQAEAVSSGVKLWVLVAAIVAGLLLFLLLALGLVKLGFFRRSKKEELDLLKNKIVLQYGDEDDADEAL